MSNVKDISKYKSPGNTIITLPLEGESESGGILIPDEARQQLMFKVVETGLKFESKDIKKGDIVLVAGKGGDRIDLQDTTYWIFPTEMVVAIVEL